MRIKQYSVYWVYLKTTANAALSGDKLRPCIITSNQTNNDLADTVQVIPITSKESRLDLPTHIPITVNGTKGTAYVENRTVVDKDCVKYYIEPLSPNDRRQIQIACLIQDGFIW